MKKRVLIIISVIIMAVILGAFLYVGMGRSSIENKMWDYLKDNDYEKTEIASIEINHSFVNILLFYNEWTIDVVFEDEPTSIYKYTLKDGIIVESGVSGTTDKEDLKH